MATSIYIASVEGHSGKSAIALGLVDAIARTVGRVGVFRPVIRSGETDTVLELLTSHDGVDLSYDECTGVTYEDVHADPAAALVRIVDRFKAIEEQSDSVVIVGSDYTDVASPTELGFNARIAANLGAQVLLVLSGRTEDRGSRTLAELRQVTDLAIPELIEAHASLLAVIANRADPDALEEIAAGLAEASGAPAWAVPESQVLIAPSVASLMKAVDGLLLRGDPALLRRESLGTVVAGMSMENVLTRLIDGGVIVVAGDRGDVIVGTMMANASTTFPTVAALVLNGGFELSPVLERLVGGLDDELPVITTALSTFATAQRISQVRGKLTADSPHKIATALALFERHVDAAVLTAAIDTGSSWVVTPLMFEYGLAERARANLKHIVLPEGEDDRILEAASIILVRGLAELTILGEPEVVRARAAALGLDLSAASILDPADPELRARFTTEYAKRRAHKGVTPEQAADLMADVSYFATMMVELGLADGMVSGATHTTAHTITPALQVIRTVDGVDVVSSVFFMALADRVLVYGDCAIVPDPTAQQLADIAISSAQTAARFGIEPRVAMLSYSTGASGTGADVEKVRQATELVRARDPELPVEGPIQYDAAADAAVARQKMPQSQVAGRATVFIFPDLNTGNNTYKAVQRSSGAVAIGPILQGLRKPVNDLSRGALVRDIVNTVAITAIQAQGVA